MATPPALPVLTANLPERWPSLPRPAQPNHQGWGHQQQNLPARVPNPILQPSELPLANHPAPAAPPRCRRASLLRTRQTTGGLDTAPCRTPTSIPEEQRPPAAPRRLPPVARLKQVLVLQHVLHVPLVQPDPAVPALDPNVPNVVPVRLLGQEEASGSKLVRGEHPRTLPVGERRQPLRLRVPVLVLGTPQRRPNRCQPVQP